MDQDPNAPPAAKKVGKASNAGGEMRYSRSFHKYVTVCSRILHYNIDAPGLTASLHHHHLVQR